VRPASGAQTACPNPVLCVAWLDIDAQIAWPNSGNCAHVSHAQTLERLRSRPPIRASSRRYPTEPSTGPTREPVKASRSRTAPVNVQAANDLHPYEAETRQIALTIPSSAGMVIDRQAGKAIAYVTDLRDASSARSAVRSATAIQIASAQGVGMSEEVEVRSARFTFLDLAEWRDSLLLWRDAVAAGVRSLDVAENENLIVVGVESTQLMSATQAVRQRVARVGGNPEAVRVMVADNIRRAGPTRGAATRRAPGDSLTSLVRPLRGGIKESVSGCTMGFIVKFDNVFYMTMAAHCSLPAAVVTGWEFKQGGQKVGYEAIDREPYVFYTPEWHYARWSEATLFRLYDSVAFDFGRVARPNSFGSLAIDQYNPYFQLTSEEQGGISNGWYVAHIGVTSGWRMGYVDWSCFDKWVPEDNYWLHCQFRAVFLTQGGDSGGPVIAPYNNGWMTVGTIYGGNEQSNGYFSGWRGLDRDLTGTFGSGRLFSR